MDILIILQLSENKVRKTRTLQEIQADQIF